MPRHCSITGLGGACHMPLNAQYISRVNWRISLTTITQAPCGACIPRQICCTKDNSRFIAGVTRPQRGYCARDVIERISSFRCLISSVLCGFFAIAFAHVNAERQPFGIDEHHRIPPDIGIETNLHALASLPRFFYEAGQFQNSPYMARLLTQSVRDQPLIQLLRPCI